jgi:hypothetical protein
MIINTTSGSRANAGPLPSSQRVINTSRVVEEDLEYVDEGAGIEFVLPGGSWVAEFEGGRREPLVFWAVLDDGRAYGVVLGRDGKVNAHDDVSRQEDFKTYRKDD